MKQKQKAQETEENLSQLLHIYPLILDSADLKNKGAFTTTIDKTTKAIKLHSIKTKPPRDPNRRRDVKYQQWVQQQEFNPFLVNTWMLLAKAEFQEGNYLRSITTFMYVTKIYSTNQEVVTESKLWIARAYSEMGWMYEAENVLRKMEQNNELLPKFSGMYASVKANIYVHNKDYVNAIPYLEQAIDREKGFQKRRNKYLLGQLYTSLGENTKAYKAFSEVKGHNSPYRYSFNAQLNQLAVSGESGKKLIASLNKMTKGKRNEEFLDQVYTSMGNVYLGELDTVKAIKHFELAIEKSTRNGYDKALAQIRIGGLYFDQQEYVKAQPHYADALPQLKKADDYYALVSLRSEVLDQLVVHAKVVHEQDSLLTVANMPEAERIAYVEKYIAKLKKEEEEQKKKEELARLEEQRGQAKNNDIISWDNLGSITPQTPQTGGGFGQQNQEGSEFYFYNMQTVEQGKITFQKKWGKRALEDNWRRRNKATSIPFGGDDDVLLANEQEEQIGESGQEQSNPTGTDVVTDKYSIEYYLQQLPLTEEAKAESNKLVENGLFNMGLIYRNLLGDNALAITTFEEDLSRFPDTPNKEEIYYQLFLIYLQQDNQGLMQAYRDKIIAEFPKGKYTIPLSDDNYAWNFKYMAKQQEDIYQETYAAYMANDPQKVRLNYETMKTKFPFVDLMPKFAFLNSLSYAQTKDAKSMEQHLTKLLVDYPQADVVPLATSILKNIKDGKIILADGTPLSGMDWTMAYSNDSIFDGNNSKEVEFRVDADQPHVLLLMFKPKSIDRNELLYEVADYNFSNYVIQTYDLKFDDDPLMSSLEVNGFKDFGAIQSYVNKALAKGGLFEKLDTQVIPVPISAGNHKEMLPRLGLDQYMTFYSDSLAKATPQLMAYWGKEVDENLVAALTSKESPELAETDVESATSEPQSTPENQPQDNQEVKPSKELPTQPVTNNEKEVNLDEVLTDDQLKAIGHVNQKADNIVESINNLGSNPVEGLKNIFKRDKLEENLTKEEKAERKQAEKEEKARLKAGQKIEKARQDSIARIEKVRLDSIKQAEKAVEDSIKMATKLEKDRVELGRKEQERIAKEQIEERKSQLKAKEQERKDMLKQREDQRKQQEQERKDKERERERERQNMIKQREEARKAKEKEMDDLRKAKEREREEQSKRRK